MRNCDHHLRGFCLIFLSRKQPTCSLTALRPPRRKTVGLYHPTSLPLLSTDGRHITGFRQALAREMGELAPAASFPVVLFDGEREIEFGSILVHPSLGFNRFQTIISQKIGISLNQISTSLVRRKKARSSPDIPRKVPISESSDFSAISRERNCFVLVTLKRPMRTRSRRRRGGVNVAYAEESDQKKAAAGTPKRTILKRSPADGGGVGFPFDGNDIPSEQRLVGLQNLRRQEKRQPLLSIGIYAEELTRESAYGGGMVGCHGAATPAEEWAARSLVCDVCRAAPPRMEGRSPPFHWCVDDAVTVGFRSSVGPIQRPLKKHIDTSA